MWNATIFIFSKGTTVHLWIEGSKDDNPLTCFSYSTCIVLGDVKTTSGKGKYTNTTCTAPILGGDVFSDFISLHKIEQSTTVPSIESYIIILFAIVYNLHRINIV